MNPSIPNSKVIRPKFQWPTNLWPGDPKEYELGPPMKEAIAQKLAIEECKHKPRLPSCQAEFHVQERSLTLITDYPSDMGDGIKLTLCKMRSFPWVEHFEDISLTYHRLVFDDSIDKKRYAACLIRLGLSRSRPRQSYVLSRYYFQVPKKGLHLSVQKYYTNDTEIDIEKNSILAISNLLKYCETFEILIPGNIITLKGGKYRNYVMKPAPKSMPKGTGCCVEMSNYF